MREIVIEKGRTRKRMREKEGEKEREERWYEISCLHST